MWIYAMAWIWPFCGQDSEERMMMSHCDFACPCQIFICETPGIWGSLPEGFKHFWDSNPTVSVTKNVVDKASFVFSAGCCVVLQVHVLTILNDSANCLFIHRQSRESWIRTQERTRYLHQGTIELHSQTKHYFLWFCCSWRRMLSKGFMYWQYCQQQKTKLSLLGLSPLDVNMLDKLAF